MEIKVERELIWSVFMILMSVDFKHRDVRWEKTTEKVKQILNETRDENEDAIPRSN